MGPKAIMAHGEMEKRLRFSAREDVAGTISLLASMAASDPFLRFHKGKSRRETHWPLGHIYTSHALLWLLPLGKTDMWSQLDQCL